MCGLQNKDQGWRSSLKEKELNIRLDVANKDEVASLPEEREGEDRERGGDQREAIIARVARHVLWVVQIPIDARVVQSGGHLVNEKVAIKPK